MGGTFFIAGLGASAGGQDALKEFLKHLPDNTAAAFVVITHLLRGHRSMLDKILQRHTSMPVQRINGPEMVRVGRVYVLPEDAIAFVRRGVLVLRPRRSEEVINYAIDALLFSLAEDQGKNAAAIIFSGMGDDGAEGAKAIHENGGRVLVQDPRSTAFTSMPNETIRRDDPEKILSPQDLARAFAALVNDQTEKAVQWRADHPSER